MAGTPNKLIFANSEKARNAITVDQQKRIAKLYEDWSKDLGERAKYYANKTTVSSALSERQAKELKKALTEQSRQVSNEVYKGIKQSIYTVSDAVVKDNVGWLRDLGFSGSSLDVAFSSVPDNIVRMLVTGQIYEGGWNLSSRIWSSNEKTLSNCYEIVAKGMAENRPIYDIAKELEKYVSPQTAKSWNPMLRMKNTKTGEWEYKRIYRGKVDYNAQRLARTLVQHGYQQSFVAVTEKNPFVLKYQWSANGSRACPLCLDRDGQVYEKDNLPMDHPNGQCTMIPVIDDNLTNKLADWFNSPDGTYPEVDEFAKGFGYKPQSSAKSLGTSTGKTFNGWYTKLSATQKELAKQLKEKSGLTWQKWYEQNIYTGKQASAMQASNNSGVVFDKAKWQSMFDSQKTEKMLSIEEAAFAKISGAQRGAITEYTSSSYTEMNGYLRYIAQGMSEEEAKRKSGIADYQLQAIKDASAGINKMANNKDIVVYRGTDLGDLAGFMQGDFYKNKAKLEKMSADELASKFNGSVGQYAGFTSTCSTNDQGQWDGSMFRGGVEFVINVPAGASGSSIMSESQYGTTEGEFLLNAGTKVYIHEVESVEGTIRVWAHVMK